MNLVQVPGWERYSWLRYGFSTRSGGVSEVYGGRSLNLGWTTHDDPALVAENRRLLVRAVTDSIAETEPSLVTLRQIHSTLVQRVRSDEEPFLSEDGRSLPEGDGLMTDVPGKLLGIQTADCVPVILVDPKKRAVAIVHAGWRGTAAGIVEIGLAAMVEEFGSTPGDLVAAVGPSIGPCCYTVGEEVRSIFEETFPYAHKLFQEDRLNLWEANRQQMLRAGVPPEQSLIIGECTACTLDASGERKYFSHRRDHGMAGRMMSVVGIAEPGSGMLP